MSIKTFFAATSAVIFSVFTSLAASGDSTQNQKGYVQEVPADFYTLVPRLPAQPTPVPVVAPPAPKSPAPRQAEQVWPKALPVPKAKDIKPPTRPPEPNKWRHLPLVVSEAKYGGHIDRNRIFPNTRPMGGALRKGDLLVGELKVIGVDDIKGFLGIRCVRMTYRHASGQVFFLTLPCQNKSDYCVGATETARVWCPLKVLTTGNPADVGLVAGGVDTEGMR